MRSRGVLARSGSQNINENGVIATAQWDTLNYGAFTLDASGRTGNSGTSFGPGFAAGGTATLWQRGLAFDRGWVADNGLGVLNSPNIGLARSQIRFYLPTWPMAGGATEWRGPSGAHIVAGVGVPGVNGGIQVPAFQTLHGSTATIGGQWSPLPQWTLGAQFSEASKVNLALGSYTSNGETASSRTAYMGVNWHNKADSVQLNLLEGTVNSSGAAWGVWLDANVNVGRYQNNFGVFRLDPGLAGQPDHQQRHAGRLLSHHLPVAPMAVQCRHRRGALGLGAGFRQHVHHRRRALPVFARFGIRRNGQHPAQYGRQHRHFCHPEPDRYRQRFSHRVVGAGIGRSFQPVGRGPRAAQLCAGPVPEQHGTDA